MAVSEIEKVKDSQTMSDADKITYLYNKIKSVLTYLTTIRTTLATENKTLDDLMDANGNNSEEHHAKTMVFYGRKVSNHDVLDGVKATDTSHSMPPNVGIFTGLDKILSQNDYGRVLITWDCWKGMNDVWKADGKPETQYLEDQPHMLGSKVTMPSIRNLDSEGVGPGTNTYKVKNGYTINGWKFDETYDVSHPVYLYDDTGNDYVRKNVGGQVQYVRDTRVFAFSSNEFKLPFNPAILPPTGKYKLVLSFIPIWFNIEFVVRHGQVGDAAPCRVPIKTQINKTITLPLATNISMDTGWQIDTDTYPYGQWSTVDPNTGTSQVDPDGDTITDMDYNAGATLNVGTDISAGVRKLYLKVKTV